MREWQELAGETLPAPTSTGEQLPAAAPGGEGGEGGASPARPPVAPIAFEEPGAWGALAAGQRSRSGGVSCLSTLCEHRGFLVIYIRGPRGHSALSRVAIP
jgi:hypothetical protein